MDWKIKFIGYRAIKTSLGYVEISIKYVGGTFLANVIVGWIYQGTWK